MYKNDEMCVCEDNKDFKMQRLMTVYIFTFKFR